MKTGVIGIGAMGASMAVNLYKAGFLASIWNRTQRRSEALTRELDVPIAADPADLAARCEIVITCVSRDPDLEAVTSALAPGLQRNAVVVDTSTVSADTARQVAKFLRKKGASFLDAPVSGGVEGAAQGTLAMMVGGDPEVLARVKKVLASITARIVHMGPVGSGQATKAVNQIMAAGINQAVTEALAFGAAMDLPMDRVVEVVSSGAAGNWFLTHRGPSMLKGIFTPGFKVALHHKDLEICRSMGEGLTDIEFPLVEKTLADYAALMEQGYKEEDISALFRLKHVNH